MLKFVVSEIVENLQLHSIWKRASTYVFTFFLLSAMFFGPEYVLAVVLTAVLLVVAVIACRLISIGLDLRYARKNRSDWFYWRKKRTDYVLREVFVGVTGGKYDEESYSLWREPYTQQILVDYELKEQPELSPALFMDEAYVSEPTDEEKAKDKDKLCLIPLPAHYELFGLECPPLLKYDQREEVLARYLLEDEQGRFKLNQIMQRYEQPTAR